MGPTSQIGTDVSQLSVSTPRKKTTQQRLPFAVEGKPHCDGSVTDICSAKCSGRCRDRAARVGGEHREGAREGAQL